MSESLNQSTEATHTPKHHTYSPFLLITFFMTLFALGISLYALWQNRQSHEDTLTLVNTLQSTNQELINTKINSYRSELAAIRKEGESLKDNVSAIANKQNQDENSWQLIKAQHLIEIAALSLYWEKNVHPAMGLLQAADKLVQGLNDPHYTPLRQVLSDEIMALKAIPEVDTVGLLSQLDTLANTISSLPLSTDKIAPDNTPLLSTLTETPQAGWRQTLDKSLDQLSKLVVIRYRKESITPILSPADRQLLIDQIQLSLQQAEWAIIQKDKALYTLSIEQAIKLVSKHYKTEEKSVSTLLNSLASLQKEDIAPTLPDINQSKTMIDKLVKQSKEVNV